MPSALGMDPDGAWYDELLVSGNKVVVIGYSYAREGDGARHLRSRRGRSPQLPHDVPDPLERLLLHAQLRSRGLISDKLILYSPLEMPTVEGDRIEWPAGNAKVAGSDCAASGSTQPLHR